MVGFQKRDCVIRFFGYHFCHPYFFGRAGLCTNLTQYGRQSSAAARLKEVLRGEACTQKLARQQLHGQTIIPVRAAFEIATLSLHSYCTQATSQITGEGVEPLAFGGRLRISP
jgi:hypothetical protein